ncbi:MAG: type II secretion system protein GspK [Candidatus Omnitrophica bacterium]|nr:type II secretion system protein GspK [Candidatus Omnitrophota bacterium]
MIGNKRGAIFITSLWILAILAILAMGIGFRVSVEARLSKYNMDSAKALYLAKAGAVKAKYRFSKSPSTADSIYECGTAFSAEEASDPDEMKAIFKGSLTDGIFSVSYKESETVYPGMSDEERKININTAPENILKNLLIYVGEDPTIASDIVQWRSSGTGLDDGYYESLPAPYKCKHAAFSVIEELLLVKGISRKIFDKLKPYVTIYGDAAKFTVNINTALKEVLSILIMADAAQDKVTSDYFADRIIELRNGPDKEKGTKDDNSFNSDVSIENVLPELSAAQIAELKGRLKIKSNFFRIESTGLVKGSKIGKSVVLVVSKSETSGAKCLYYREH